MTSKALDGKPDGHPGSGGSRVLGGRSIERPGKRGRERSPLQRQQAPQQARRHRSPSSGGTSRTTDPGKADFQAIADAYTAAHPNVTIKVTVLENEALKDASSHGCRPATRPTSSSRGAAASCDSRSRRVSSRTSPRISRTWKDTIGGGAMSIYQVTTASTASPTTSASSASGTTRISSRRPASARRRPRGTSSSRRREAQGRGHHPHLAMGGKRQVAVHVLVGVSRPPHRRRDSHRPGGPERRLERVRPS